jgi:small basic protein
MNENTQKLVDASALVSAKAPSQTQSRSIPMSVGVALLWLLFWPGLIAWWVLMSALFRQGAYVEGVLIAYSLPTIYTLAAYFGSRRSGSYIKLLHFGAFFILSITYIAILGTRREIPPLDDAAPYLSIAFIAAVMSLMQYPRAGLKNYDTYRSSLFIGGVIFMPLFIYIAALLPNVLHTPALDKVYLFPIGMLGFWLSAAWLVLRTTQGGHISGLEISPLLPFRPDFILPGGVTYVKGTILMGVGLMIAIHPQLGMPQWNWWGFVLAFWGIITIIPLRGMYKMVKSRRLRMLGLGGTGFGHEINKGLILFIGLLIMLYGFVNAFIGEIPFTALGVKAEFNTFATGTQTGQAIAIVTFILAFIVLVPLRGWYKLRLLEGVETRSQIVIKQLLLWLGTLLLFISFIHLFNLPPIRNSGYIGFYPENNLLGFVVGLVLFLAGSILILILRPIALRNELEATMLVMVGVASDQPDNIRKWMLERRVRTIAAMPEEQRNRHVAWMAQGLSQLPDEKRSIMMDTQMMVLASVDAETRRRIMSAMDQAMMGGA